MAWALYYREGRVSECRSKDGWMDDVLLCYCFIISLGNYTYHVTLKAHIVISWVCHNLTCDAYSSENADSCLQASYCLNLPF